MKVIEKYTPSKGLFTTVSLLIIDLLVQLYLMSSIVNFEIIDNMVYCDLQTVSILTAYVLTSVCLLIILSEFFEVKKVESQFSLLGTGIYEVEKQSKESAPPMENEVITLPKLDSSDFEEELGEPEVDPLISDGESEEEDPIDNLLFGFSNEDEVEESDEKETIDSPSYKMVSIKMEDLAPEESVEESDVGFDDSYAVDISESEILQTLSELKNLMSEMKTKKGM